MIASLLLPLLGPVLAGVLVVSPDSAYHTIAEALAAAQAGDTIRVLGGAHQGPLVIDQALTLEGVDWPVIDGGGHGSVVTITAPGTTIRGFVVRGSGHDLNDEDGGVVARAAGVVIEGNRFQDVLTGISLDNSPNSIIRGNHILGKPELDVPMRGDGLRLWYSSNVLVERNHVDGTRDCVIWYSANLRMVDNIIENGRYGLHFMYDDGADLQGNVLRHNSVGAYLMYSRNVHLRGNLLAANRGPSGFGLGLKDVDDLRLEHNWVVDNRVGAWIDSSPSSSVAKNRFETNVFAFNDIGLALQPSIQRNTFVNNAFQDNQQQISLQGSGTLQGNHWTEAGLGNYWSDYRGFDANGDGRGDVAYRAESLIGDLMDRQPGLRLFQFGLAANAVEFAATVFPVMRPPAKMVDDAPLLTPPTVPAPPGQTSASHGPPLLAMLGLIGLAGGLLALTRLQPAGRPTPVRGGSGGAVLEAANVSKRYGRVQAVDSLGFSIAPGEAVALWGPNGAGKTTALRCILGLVPCQGAIRIAGVDALRAGRLARRHLGYMPQDVALHDDLTVAETIGFYARLKRVESATALPLLATLGLADHAAKTVGALSGGLRQRLALGIALLGDPPLLVLDEPMANLDAAGRDLVSHLLQDLRAKGTALLVTSHRVEEIEALAERVLVLDRGRLAFECTPRELPDRLGLWVTLKLHVARADHARANAALAAGGLTASPNSRGLLVTVSPLAKALPLRLLNEAGIPITDFSIEDATVQPTKEPGT